MSDDNNDKKHPLDFNLISLAKEKVEIPERPEISVEDLRHQQMMEAISGFAKPTQQKNLTPVYVDYKSRETKIAWVMCPEWAPEFPPFNLCRLSGICKAAGFESRIWDLNVRAYNEHENDWRPNEKIPFRLWDPSASWHWLGDTYMQDIHHLLVPLFEKAIEEILEYDPDIIGFSQYYISEEPTKWMCKRIKELRPDIMIAVGGSNVQKDWFAVHDFYDYVVTGEGEAVILEILEEIEQGIRPEETKIYKQNERERININGLPMPDYEGIDFSEYRVPNGVTSEFSRGCTAKCTFCEETHFWKYRQRQAVDVIQEAEWLWYNKGVDVMWFIDSLVNGDPNELRAFARAIKAKGLPTKWTGYARCDGRMDEEYFKDLAEGGCLMFNYGCESGSQNVLDDMAKGVTIQEMEDNFKWGKKYGIAAATNWIVGFPTEKRNDFAKTMQFLWRNRNMNINNVGAGVGMAVGIETIVGQNPPKFNVSGHKYMNHWIANDFTIGGTHVMHRVKTFYSFLDHMVGCTEIPFGYPVRFALAAEHYTIKLDNPDATYEIEYEDFDYDIIKPGISPFADNLVNEIWPFLRTLWRTRGGFEAEILFNPEIDLKEFGSQYGPGMFNGVYRFRITDDGHWRAHFTYKFEQIDNPYDGRPPEKRGPFYAQDYSQAMSNSALRSRRLAKPDWDIKTGRTSDEVHALLEEEWFLNEHVDFSFEYEYEGTGEWQRNSNEIAVPSKMSMGVLNQNNSLNPDEPDEMEIGIIDL